MYVEHTHAIPAILLTGAVCCLAVRLAVLAVGWLAALKEQGARGKGRGLLSAAGLRSATPQVLPPHLAESTPWALCAQRRECAAALEYSLMLGVMARLLYQDAASIFQGRTPPVAVGKHPVWPHIAPHHPGPSVKCSPATPYRPPCSTRAEGCLRL